MKRRSVFARGHQRGILALLATLLAASACRSPHYEISLVEGTAHTRFPIRSAYAEYIELPNRNELRLMFADYAVSCERWIPPKGEDHALTVVVQTGPKDPPKAGSYPWSGLSPEGQPPRYPNALPKALFAAQTRLFEPGGSIRLSEVRLEPRGSVRGTLDFEFPGEATRPATKVAGSFEAKMCRWSEAPR